MSDEHLGPPAGMSPEDREEHRREVEVLVADLLETIRGFPTQQAIPATAVVLCCLAQGLEDEAGNPMTREDFLGALGATWDEQLASREADSILVCTGCASPKEQVPGAVYAADIEGGVCARCEQPLTLSNVLRIHPGAPIN